MAASMEVDHDVVLVDEFDALSVQVKLPTELAVSAPTEKTEKYPAKLHARKVAKEIGVENGIIYLPGEPSRFYEDSDMSPAFRQRRYFYYIAGVDFKNCAVTYDIAKDRLNLWIPVPPDPRRVLYLGKTPTRDECKHITDVHDVRLMSRLSSYLSRHLNHTTPLYVLHKDQTPDLSMKPGFQLINIHDLRPAMDAARVIKTDFEIAMIHKANAISSAGHRAVLKRLRDLKYEREIAAVFEGHCIGAGATQAYPVIAGSGPNAATLHYIANADPLAGRQLVVLDAGASWGCYASDVTRSFPVSGKFTTEARAIYDIVHQMQAECIARVKPGVPYRALHLHAALVAVNGLRRLGILKGGSAGDIFKAGTVAAFFPHGLGHHVGLETHDVLSLGLLAASAPAAANAARTAAGWVGGIQTQSRVLGRREWVTAEMQEHLVREDANDAVVAGTKLQKGMVVTIEPGIYFSRQYIETVFLSNPTHARFIDKKLLDKYYPVGGVRIEDCILVTEDGYEDLTTAPKGDEMLDIINGR